ncbi:hypothetical protein BD770DRAFT_94013 [Pilaira anomala]|nr:hypothetical protein BD770DRAFT_94013 [Pilaira anomala]
MEGSVEQYRYTRNQKAKETKSTKFKKLRQQLKPKDIQDFEDKLSKCLPLTVKREAFVKYLKIRAEVTSKMQEYYSNEDVEKDKKKKELIPFRKMKLSAHINKIQSTKRLSKNIRKKFGKGLYLNFGGTGLKPAIFLRSQKKKTQSKEKTMTRLNWGKKQ